MTNIKTKNNKLLIAWGAALIGVLILIISIFLPYMTAVGEMADYLESFPDKLISDDYDALNKDFAKFPITSTSKIIEILWGENDAMIANIFLIVFGSFAVLTTLFILFKKPIITIFFDLLTCGTFLFMSELLTDHFIGANKFAWGIGFFLTLIAIAIIFISSILMLIFKIIQKKQQNFAKDQL